MKNGAPLWIWIPQLAAACILGPLAWLKLSGNPADIAIFTTLGMEPVGRFAIGIIEGIAALLLISPFAAPGSVLALCVMVGAMIAHTTRLGTMLAIDGGAHLALLAVVLICSALVAFVRRRELPMIGDSF